MKPPLTTAALSWADHHPFRQCYFLRTVANDLQQCWPPLFIHLCFSNYFWFLAQTGRYVLLFFRRLMIYVALSYFISVPCFIFIFNSNVLYTLFFFSCDNYLHFFFLSNNANSFWAIVSIQSRIPYPNCIHCTLRRQVTGVLPALSSLPHPIPHCTAAITHLPTHRGCGLCWSWMSGVS